MRTNIKGKFVEVSNGNLKVVLSCLGAAIAEIKYDDDLMTMTPINYDDLNREEIYYGKTIGPIANRIKDGLVTIDNKNYYLPLNEKGVCNHSGKIGLSNQLFDVSIEDGRVIFIYKDNLFDGEISYQVIYSFFSDNQIRIDYIVKTANKAILSLTNHTFFTLGESGLDNLLLNIATNRFVESDKKTLLPLAVKPFTQKIDISKGSYDSCFLLNNNEVILRSPKYCLTIQSNYSSVQIYTDNFEDGVLVENTNLKTRRAVAIEPEDNLLEKTLINKDEIYQRYITYTFLKR